MRTGPALLDKPLRGHAVDALAALGPEAKPALPAFRILAHRFVFYHSRKVANEAIAKIEN